MGRYRRIFTIVIDSLGTGAMPDADRYGDEKADTLGHISEVVDEFRIPHMQSLKVCAFTFLPHSPHAGHAAEDHF